MTDETLHQLLARVHERLSASDSVDPEARDMLTTVMRDIDASSVGATVSDSIAKATDSGSRESRWAVTRRTRNPAS